MTPLLLLLAAAASNVTIDALPDGRFRVTTTVDGSDPEVYALALLRLRAAAQAQCSGRGAPVSDGAIQMDRVAGRPGRLALAEVYACRP